MSLPFSIRGKRLPSGYLTVCHGKWPIEIDGLPSYKMVIFHGELLNNKMVIVNQTCSVYSAWSWLVYYSYPIQGRAVI